MDTTNSCGRQGYVGVPKLPTKTPGVLPVNGAYAGTTGTLP